MSTTRVLIKHGEVLYRFIRVDALADGSLMFLIDRSPDAKRGGMILIDGSLQPDSQREDEIAPHGKFTCHTTGQVNRYASGIFRNSHHIDPLTRLSQAALVGLYSIPRPSRLNAYDKTSDTADVIAVLEIPYEIDERLSFALEMMPLGAPQPESFGVILNYEVYSAAVRIIPLSVPSELAEHFVEGSPASGDFQSRQLDAASAEIEFHQKVHGGQVPIFREESGAYIHLAQVPMRVPPKLTVEFAQSDLSAEQISLSGNAPITHKVRFWIRDKGGRNKTDDLRSKIVSVALDSEL